MSLLLTVADSVNDELALLDAVMVGETVTLLLTVADGVNDGLTLLDAVMVGVNVSLLLTVADDVNDGLTLLDVVNVGETDALLLTVVEGSTDLLTLGDSDNDTVGEARVADAETVTDGDGRTDGDQDAVDDAVGVGSAHEAPLLSKVAVARVGFGQLTKGGASAQLHCCEQEPEPEPPTTTKLALQVSVHVVVVVRDRSSDEPQWHVDGDHNASFLLQPAAAIATDGRIPDHTPFASVAPGQS